MQKEIKIIYDQEGNEIITEGYFLTLDELEDLVWQYTVDNHDGFVSNNKSYLENKLNEKFQKNENKKKEKS